MELKYKIKSVIMVNFNDLDEFLAKRFGLPERYEFTAMEELGNDIVKSINVYRKELSEYDQKYIDEFLVTKKPQLYRTCDILCHLCNLGEIPEGEYLIEVSW
jgi:hypothetical protein